MAITEVDEEQIIAARLSGEPKRKIAGSESRSPMSETSSID
jgi:hypothetical protein